MARFRFYCDESHDSTNKKRKPGEPSFEPRSFLVGGMFGDVDAWKKIEPRWKRKNDLEGVQRFHAAHLNARTWEYEGWSNPRKIAYSQEMLKILKSSGRYLHGVSIGLFADEYRRIITDKGKVQLGHPYLVCFKTLIATLGVQIENGGYEYDDQVDIVLDRGDHSEYAAQLFSEIKSDPQFRFRHRMGECTAESSDDVIGLQVADLVAYESMRLMHDRRTSTDYQMRPPIRSMLAQIKFLGMAFGSDTLERIKDDVDKMDSKPNGFVIVPPWFSAEDAPKHLLPY